MTLKILYKYIAFMLKQGMSLKLWETLQVYFLE